MKIVNKQFRYTNGFQSLFFFVVVVGGDGGGGGNRFFFQSKKKKYNVPSIESLASKKIETLSLYNE